jgi:hypothetical protein
MRWKNLKRKPAAVRQKKPVPVRVRARSGLSHAVTGKLGRELADR